MNDSTTSRSSRRVDKYTWIALRQQYLGVILEMNRIHEIMLEADCWQDMHLPNMRNVLEQSDELSWEMWEVYFAWLEERIISTGKEVKFPSKL